mgnify:CR=1 FL=1
MWQAISNLLSEQHTDGAEIELRNELPGGEIHAAWHLRFGGKDYFVKCDERELLPIFTAEADQLELLSRCKTVSVPQVFAVGSDRDYSFLVMEYISSIIAVSARDSILMNIFNAKDFYCVLLMCIWGHFVIKIVHTH